MLLDGHEVSWPLQNKFLIVFEMCYVCAFDENVSLGRRPGVRLDALFDSLVGEPRVMLVVGWGHVTNHAWCCEYHVCVLAMCMHVRN